MNQKTSKLKEIEKIISDNKTTLEQNFKVSEIGIFGSYLRGAQKKKSDLDVLVEFSEPVGLFHFMRLEDFLSALTGVKVDLVLKSALKPRIKDNIIKEALYL